MAVTIKRKTGGSGAGTKTTINVNGEKVAKIAHQEEIELDIQNEPAVVKVKQFGVKSNDISVENGDVLEIKTAKINYITVLSLFIYIIVSSFDQMAAYAALSCTTCFVLFVCNFFLFDGFHLKIKYNKSESRSFEQMKL